MFVTGLGAVHPAIGVPVKFKSFNGNAKVADVFIGAIGVIVGEHIGPTGIRRWLVYHPDIKWNNKVTMWDSDSIVAQNQKALDPDGFFKTQPHHALLGPTHNDYF